MTYHTAFGQLDYALGGYFTLSSFPMYPFFNEVPLEEYKLNNPTEIAKMKWFIFTSGDDYLFHPQTHLDEITKTFDNLVSKES